MPRPKREDGRNSRTIASNKYNEKAYDRINYVVQAGYKDVIKAAEIIAKEVATIRRFKPLPKKWSERRGDDPRLFLYRSQ